MKTAFLFLAIFSSSVVASAESLKSWDYSDMKDIAFSAQQGNKAEMRVSTNVNTPGGERALEVEIQELKPGSAAHFIQLKFNCKEGLKAGHTYEVSFPCKATEPGSVSMVAALSVSPYTFLPNAKKSFETSREWSNVTFIFSIKNDIAQPVSTPLIMLGGYGAQATLYFGPAVLWDLADKSKNVSKDNIVFNSSFELDDAGYATAKHLYLPRNPELKFEKAGGIDTTTYISGKKSLKLSNPYGDEVRLYPRELYLESDTKYTLSMWLKSEKPASVKMQMFNHKWASYETSFSITTEWKRYKYTFTTKQDDANPHVLYIAAGMEPQASSASVWVDDIQLAQGDEDLYAPGSAIETICAPAQNYFVSKDGKANVSSLLKVINNSKNTTERTFTVFVTDDYTGDVAFSKDITMSLKAGEYKEYPVEITVSAFGSYIIDVKQQAPSALKCSSQISCFGVIGKYEVKPIDLDRTFCVSFNGPAGWIFYHPVLTTKPRSIRVSDCSPDEYAMRLSMMGCRLLRDWEARFIDWPRLEPEDGKYDFSYADKGIDILVRHGISILPVLEPRLNYVENNPKTKYEYPQPEWMKELRRNSPVVKGTLGIAKGRDFFIVPDKQWREYVQAVATHFKGRISHYEVFNEPNFYSCPSAEIYMDFLKSAAAEIHKADSNAKMVSFCSTGDKGESVEAFLEQCFKLDGLTYADAVSWHPYFARELSSKVPADEQIKNIKGLMSQYGKPDTPLWNTECYIVYGTHWDYNDAGKAHHIARKFLTELGEGVAQSISIPDYNVWRDVLTPNFKVSHTPVIDTRQPLPSANYVAYNALARLFEGAKPVGKWRWQDSAVCYAYEKDGNYIAALWNYSSRNAGLQITLSANSGVIELFDIFGNKLPFNGQSLAIDIAPKYLQWKNGNTASVKSSIANATIGNAKPFRIDRSILIQDSRIALMSVCNLSGKSIKNAVCTINGTEKIEIGAFAPMELKEIEVPVAAAGGKLKVEINGAEKPFVSEETPAKVTSLPLLAGKPAAYIALDKSVIGKPNSREDFSASFAARYEGNTLRLKIKVKDDKRSEHGKWIWDEDAVQLYIDAFPMKTSGTFPEYASTTYKVEVSAWRDGDAKINNNGFPGKIEAETKELSDGYELSVRVPLDAVPGLKIVKGTKIGFDISVEDSDGKSRKTELVWSGTADNHKNRSQFAIIEFR